MIYVALNELQLIYSKMCISKITLILCHRGMKSYSIHEAITSNKDVLWSKANLFLWYKNSKQICFIDSELIRRKLKYYYD